MVMATSAAMIGTGIGVEEESGFDVLLLLLPLLVCSCVGDVSARSDSAGAVVAPTPTERLGLWCCRW